MLSQSPGLFVAESKDELHHENPKEEWKKMIASFYVAKKRVAKKHLEYLTHIMLPISSELTKKAKIAYESSYDDWQNLILEEENKILAWDKIGAVISQDENKIKLAEEICHINTYRWKFLEKQKKLLEKTKNTCGTINNMSVVEENLSCEIDDNIGPSENKSLEKSYMALLSENIWNTGQRVTETASAVVDKWVFSPVKS